jgi:endonuclease/exonuclease/phosphatase family metal-dependent hydrolase
MAEPAFKYVIDGATSPATLTVAADGVEKTVTVEATGAWSVAVSAGAVQWLHVLPANGEKNGAFTLTVDENAATATRTGTLTFSMDGKATGLLNVVQEVAAPPVTPVTVPELPATGGDLVFTVTCGGAWSYTLNGATWLTETGRTESALTLTAAANPSAGRNSATVTFTTACGTADRVVAQSGTPYKVMSFNMRYDANDPGNQHWTYRKEVIIDLIKTLDIDLLGSQEPMTSQLNEMIERLPEYVVLGAWSNGAAGSHDAIFYKKDKFDQVSTGHFWLSDTPDVPGSVGWDANGQRGAEWVILQEKCSDLRLFFINTHLDHIGATARYGSAQLLVARTQALAGGLPFILTGDFNTQPGTAPIQFILNSGLFHDARSLAPPPQVTTGTFHNWGQPVWEIIDYIFVSGDWNVHEFQVGPGMWPSDAAGQNIYVSDHSPIQTKISL